MPNGHERCTGFNALSSLTILGCGAQSSSQEYKRSSEDRDLNFFFRQVRERESAFMPLRNKREAVRSKLSRSPGSQKSHSHVDP